MTLKMLASTAIDGCVDPIVWCTSHVERMHILHLNGCAAIHVIALPDWVANYSEIM